jgi:ubiquinone biosynthesis protein COQ4
MLPSPTTRYVPPPLPLRIGRATRALYTLFRDPDRLEQVFIIGENLNASRFPDALEKLQADPETRWLVERPRLIDTAHVDLDALARLPDGTLGREYVRFLRDNHITPDVFQLPTVADPRVAYLMLRIRQTHDLWHVLTGYTPDVVGELLLQVFTYAQIRVPSALAIAAVGSFRVLGRAPDYLHRVAVAYRRGRATRQLAAFPWEDHWAEPLSELRSRLHCPSEAESPAAAPRPN